MTSEAARLVAGVLARRLGIEASELEPTLGDSPIGAAMALSLLESPRAAAAVDAAALLRGVASRVGACPACLGEVEECSECNGRGGPGSRAADTGALVMWIARPLHQVGLCVGRPRRMPAADNLPGGYTR
jgi:hypothetical protein